MKVKVSVIIPVYNVEEYIDKCLKSLINQTLKEIEIIVVNDGSPDNSQKIIDKYVKKYPEKVKSFIKENGGQGSARNYGLLQANGEYIAYVDSDDWVETNMLEEMYNKAISDNSDVVVCGNNVVSMNGEIIKVEPAVIYNDTNLDILFGKMAVWNKIYKKELLLKNKIEFRQKVWYEDIDFSVKILFDTLNVSFVDKPFYNYLLRPGSTMNNSNIKRNLELNLAFDEMINYFKNKNTYEENYEKLEFLCLYHMYISGITRVINCKVPMKDKKVIINKYIDYVKNNFKTFKNNKYIKYMDRNKKIIYNLINLKLYRVVELIFKIKNG